MSVRGKSQHHLLHHAFMQNGCRSQVVVNLFTDQIGLPILRHLHRSTRSEHDPVDDVIKNERKRLQKRSSNHVLGGQAVADQPNGPVVEFFNPKIRQELEKKDADYLKRTGLKGAAPGGDTWVWLTSYSRIPVSAIE